jgi:hypothetical protein
VLERERERERERAGGSEGGGSSEKATREQVMIEIINIQTADEQ